MSDALKNSRYRQILSWAGSGWSDQWAPPDLNEDARRERDRRRTQTTAADFGPEATGRQGRGLVMGRFLPPHRGHQYLVDVARLACTKLTIVVAGGAADPIPVDARVAWLTEMAPDALVVALSELGADGDLDLGKNAALRKKLVRLAKPDLFFSSEVYGATIAGWLSARHVMVDPERTAVPISGTRLREAPMENWRFLPACVRPHYVKRVRLIGPESTGKSTLATKLAQHFGSVAVPECARTLRRSAGRDLLPSDIESIAHLQLASEDALARQAERVLFCDTDLLSLRLWSERLFGLCPAWIGAEAARRHATTAAYALDLLLEPDVPFVGDPVLDEPDRRRQFFANCKTELERLPGPLVTISGNWDQRFETARAAVEKLLAGAR